MIRFIITFAVIAAGLLCCAAGWWRLNEARLARYEAFCRNRIIGLFGTWAALLLCMEHAGAVSPGFLHPLLLPLALILPVLCCFYLEYLCARAVAGLAILAAYEVLHLGFEFHVVFSPLLAVAAWCLGLAGIWVSGRPCSLRDWFRFGAKHRWMRRFAAAVFALFALLVLTALFFTAAEDGYV